MSRIISYALSHAAIHIFLAVIAVMVAAYGVHEHFAAKGREMARRADNVRRLMDKCRSGMTEQEVINAVGYANWQGAVFDKDPFGRDPEHPKTVFMMGNSQFLIFEWAYQDSPRDPATPETGPAPSGGGRKVKVLQRCRVSEHMVEAGN